MRNETLIFLTLTTTETDGINIRAIIEETDQPGIKIHIQSYKLRRRQKRRHVTGTRRRSLKRSKRRDFSEPENQIAMTCYILTQRDGAIKSLSRWSGTISRESFSSG